MREIKIVYLMSSPLPSLIYGCMHNIISDVLLKPSTVWINYDSFKLRVHYYAMLYHIAADYRAE